MRTYGKLWLDNGKWHLDCEPHVAMWAKRIFGRLGTSAQGVLTLSHSDQICRDLEWFSLRFPLDIKDVDLLRQGSRQQQERLLTLEKIVGGKHRPRKFSLALPVRRYQAVAAELFLANRFLLLGDDTGIGKTVSAIAAFREQTTLPACVVTLAHLPRQWEAEIQRFAPDLQVHVIQKSSLYPIPTFMGRSPDVLVINYHKLSGWAETLARYCRCVVFDEIQELRHSTSAKYAAAQHLARGVQYVLGLSATPIYNYGGEIYNVLDILHPQLLGTHEEFAREWCEGYNLRKLRLKNPTAFGSYLREQHIMLRRTRADVGRELPALQRIVQEVDYDNAALDAIEDAASELARIILDRSPRLKGEKFQAAEEFNTLLRQATGISKAPYVAAFVRLLIENGERIVLYGWHRAVYDIWLAKLRDYQPAMYTGSEPPQQKAAQFRRFVTGETPLLIMSLRSGAGLDGLQHCCRTVVIGELDWSPGVHEQCIGRVYRDGQPDPVAVYFMLADAGADPVIATTLGIKREQIEGLRDLGKGSLERLERGVDAVRQLAEAYLAKTKRRRRR